MQQLVYYIREKLYDNIKRGPLQVPEDISQTALDLIVKLLNRDPSKRLGAGPGDAEEIKQHSFFKGINWEDVIERKLKPPKIQIKKIEKATGKFAVFEDNDPQGDDKTKLLKWTFAHNDFQ